MKGLITLIMTLALPGLAGSLPVDEEIAALRSKADYLETLKNTLGANACTIQLDANTVPLAAGALRSEGLVMAVAPGMPGNYLAFYLEPKPELLKNIVKYSGAGDGASIVTAQLGRKADGSFSELVVTINEPKQIQRAEDVKHDDDETEEDILANRGSDDWWIYSKTVLKLAFTNGKLVGSTDGKSAVLGQALTLSCH